MTGHDFRTFHAIDLDQMTLVQGHDTLYILGHKQSFNQLSKNF